MGKRPAPKALFGLLACLIAAVVLSACGSSSNENASTLLKQTFSGSHPVNSGNLNFSLSLAPSGSSTLNSPLNLSFGGPFQSQGTGKLPKSDFSLRVSAQGKTGTLGLLSTGTAGYVTLQGSSYQLPTATFQRLESSFSQLASSPGSGSGSGTLSKLGIHPLDWLSNPSVVGDENVGGAQTTHIRATVNVDALLGDVNTFLAKASSLGISGASRLPTTLSPTTRQKIAGEVQNPTFDVWTGKSDKTIRRLTIHLTLPVTGTVSTELGGLRSAQVGLSMQYADLNQPQTITTPTNVRPFTEFTSKLQTILATVQSSLVGAASGSSAGALPNATGTTPGATGSSSQVQNYSQCITNAKGDVTKLQQCAALINGK